MLAQNIRGHPFEDAFLHSLVTGLSGMKEDFEAEDFCTAVFDEFFFTCINVDNVVRHLIRLLWWVKIRSDIFYSLFQQGGYILAFLPPDLRPCSKLPSPQGVVRLWRRCTRRSRRGSPIVKGLPWRPHPLKSQQPLSRMWHLSHFLEKHPYRAQWALDAAHRDTGVSKSHYFVISISIKYSNFSRFYKKMGPFYKKFRCDKFGN